MMQQRRVALSTGVTLNVATAGPEDAPPLILLHGFPESHRTWRGLVPLLANDYRLVMPDQRGFAGSDRPHGADAYHTDHLIADLLALADAMDIETFTLIGHDWGGAVAWAATLRGGPRIQRLAIINSPHPLIFQKTIIEDEAQRAASQYMRRFREPGMAEAIQAMGWETFFTKSFSPHIDLTTISDAERAAYIAEWSQDGAIEAMLAWYVASPIIVPAMDETVALPDWVLKGVPDIHVPVKIIWGMEDKALLPCQLEGLDALIDDLSVTRLDGVGHFAPWQAPEQVAAPLRDWLSSAA
ncbi:alpha/beta fold hydrolase [Sphingomicrobium flavum]|uniref:alpha/beta fold hydrolase n=1 Tax=Sphingomicrobium flavum TaxID=1229164 RepID=UPI0021AD93DE|nr:alpha/beta hydrolase [Sphingomicrobium flavum]